MEENLFRSIPRVDELLGRDELKVSALPPVLLRESVREELDALRDAALHLFKNRPSKLGGRFLCADSIFY